MITTVISVLAFSFPTRSYCTQFYPVPFVKQTIMVNILSPEKGNIVLRGAIRLEDTFDVCVNESTGISYKLSADTNKILTKYNCAIKRIKYENDIVKIKLQIPVAGTIDLNLKRGRNVLL